MRFQRERHAIEEEVGAWWQETINCWSPDMWDHRWVFPNVLKKVIHEDGHSTQHCMRTVHAEQNAICQAAKNGVALKDATLYCRMTPCRTCAMLIINSGIVRVVAERRYHAGAESEAMFQMAGIKLEFKFDEVQTYV